MVKHLNTLLWSLTPSANLSLSLEFITATLELPLSKGTTEQEINYETLFTNFSLARGSVL